MAPEPCYWCGTPRDAYFGMLCEECREAARAAESERREREYDDDETGGT
jgi:hypothetical protein